MYGNDQKWDTYGRWGFAERNGETNKISNYKVITKLLKLEKCEHVHVVLKTIWEKERKNVEA